MACVLKFGLLAVAAASDPNQTQSTHNVSAEQERYIHEYADPYRDQYAHNGNQSAEDQERMSQMYRQRYAAPYMQQYPGQQNRSQNHLAQHYMDEYVPANVRHYIHKNRNATQNSSSPVLLVAQADQVGNQSGQGGDYSKYFAQYVGGQGSQGGGDYSHYYSQYMPQGGPQGAGSQYNQKYMPGQGGQSQGSGSPTMMAAQGGADYQQYMPQGGQGSQGGDYAHYYSQYMPQGGNQSAGQGGQSQGSNYSHYYSQYMPQGGPQGAGSQYYQKYMPGQGGQSQGSGSPTMMAAQGGQGSQGGDYAHYYSQYMQQGGNQSAGSQDYQKYMQGQGGQSQGSNYSHYYSQYMQQGGSPTMMAAQGGADYQQYMHQGGQGQSNNYSHYYSQYMQQGGSAQGGANYQQYMQQGGAPTMMAVQGQQAQNKSGTGFQGYMERYLPPGDSHYTDSYTSGFSNQTASQESTGSTGAYGYDQYVDRYSAMAGAHPSSGSDWQSQSASQSSGYQTAVGSQIPGAGSNFLGGSTPQASAAAASAVSLAASPRQSKAEASHWSSIQLVACIFAGFSLPAALAFVSTLRKTSRSLTDFEETGFQRLVEV